jgi:threonine dehydrogenase-like Zn-dependent dehydrogenase
VTDRTVAILGAGTMGLLLLLLLRIVVAHGAKRVVVTDRGPTNAAGPPAAR